MIKNAFYEGEAFPKDFYENEDSYKTVDESEKYKEVDKSKKNCRILPTQLMNLLPLIASQLLYTLFCSTLKSNGKGYFYPMTLKAELLFIRSTKSFDICSASEFA